MHIEFWRLIIFVDADLATYIICHNMDYCPANESIEIPVGGATGQYTVDWGDGSQDMLQVTRSTGTLMLEHTL